MRGRGVLRKGMSPLSKKKFEWNKLSFAIFMDFSPFFSIHFKMKNINKFLWIFLDFFFSNFKAQSFYDEQFYKGQGREGVKFGKW